MGATKNKYQGTNRDGNEAYIQHVSFNQVLIVAEREEPIVFKYLPVRITVLTSSMPSDVKGCGDMLGSPTNMSGCVPSRSMSNFCFITLY
jgi:hypothetical protein